MRQKKLLSCSSILQNATAAVLRRGRQLSRLDQAVRQQLPADVAEHCQVLNFKDGVLVLAADSAARATRLRFAVPALQSSLQQQLNLNLAAIKIRVLPETPEHRPVARQPQTLSIDSANLLAQTAQTLDHPGLKEALYRIAARVKNN